MSAFEDNSPIMKGSEAEKAADFANYFWLAFVTCAVSFCP